MKKIGIICLLLVITLALSACGKELVEYQGVWQLGESDYLIIAEDEVSQISKDAMIRLYAETMRKTVIEKGEDAFWALSPEAIPAAEQREMLSDTAAVHELQLGESTLTAQKDRLTLSQGETQHDLTQVNSEASFTGEWAQALFAQAKQDIVVQMDQLMPTLEEYTAFLKEQNPDMEKWKEVKRDDAVSMISDTGKEKKHAGALTVSDTSLLYSKGSTKKGVGNFSVEYDGKTITVTHKYFGDLREIVEFTAPVLDALPYNLSTEQLLAIYMENRTCDDKLYTFQYAQSGVEFTITRSTSGRKTEVKISVPETVKVPAAPLERKEAPYVTGFHTPQFANLEHEKRYKITYKFEDFLVYDTFIFYESGKFKETISFEMGYEAYSDEAVGTYETDGDLITMYMEMLTAFDEERKNIEITKMVFRYDNEKMTLTQVGDRGLSWKHKDGHKYTIKAK